MLLFLSRTVYKKVGKEDKFSVTYLSVCPSSPLTIDKIVVSATVSLYFFTVIIIKYMEISSIIVVLSNSGNYLLANIISLYF